MPRRRNAYGFPKLQPSAAAPTTAVAEPALARPNLELIKEEQGTAEPERPAYSFGSKRTITLPQQERLFAIARECGWTNDEVKTFLNAEYGIAQSSDIPVAQYDEIISVIQQSRSEEARHD